MRRGFSIFLILFFGLGPLSALTDGSDDASLPPCCRRHGAHHCAMNMRMVAMMSRIPDPRPSFTVPSTCPLYPGSAIAILAPAHALTAAAVSPQIAWTRSPVPVHVRAAAYVSPSRTHAGRGPPARDLT